MRKWEGELCDDTGKWLLARGGPRPTTVWVHDLTTRPCMPYFWAFNGSTDNILSVISLQTRKIHQTNFCFHVVKYSTSESLSLQEICSLKGRCGIQTSFSRSDFLWITHYKFHLMVLDMMKDVCWLGWDMRAWLFPVPCFIMLYCMNYLFRWGKKNTQHTVFSNWWN